jgi:protein phosphatase
MADNFAVPFLINISATTDIGTVRKENEDFHYFSKEKKFAIVCDGMGGHEKGAMASRFAGETLRDVFFATDSKKELAINGKPFNVKQACADVTQKLPDALLHQLAATRLANRRILSHALLNSHMQGMGTTILSAVLTDSRLMIAHIGDSRIYRLRKGVLKCLTKDHSWLNELIEDNEISEADVKNFQKKNVLTRALGISATLKVDLHVESIEADDLYLMCTDGLFNALEDELIKSILSAHHGSLQNKVSNLVKRAKLMDGSDNITACLMHIASLPSAPDEETSEKFTITDEPENITQYLDQKAKEIYPASIEKPKNKISRRINLVGLTAVALVVTALILFYISKKADRSGPVVQSALFGQLHAAKPKTPDKIAAQIEHAGKITLIQVFEDKYLNFLNSVPGIKVLDTIEKFNNNIPVNSGNFTWAVADEKENIVYKRKNIFLQPAEQWQKEQKANAQSHQGLFETSQNEKDAVVYLLGDFDSKMFLGASVYLNNAYKGRLEQFRKNGVYIDGGIYQLEIKDIAARTILTKNTINIKDGEVIAIEF